MIACVLYEPVTAITRTVVEIVPKEMRASYRRIMRRACGDAGRGMRVCPMAPGVKTYLMCATMMSKQKIDAKQVEL